MMSTRTREKRQRLILSLRPCLKKTAMLMQLAGKPMRKRTGMRTVALILSKSCSVSRLMRLLGLFHGMVVFMPRMMQFSGTLFADWLTSIVHGDIIAVSVEMPANPSTDEDTTVYFDDLDDRGTIEALWNTRPVTSVNVYKCTTTCDGGAIQMMCAGV